MRGVLISVLATMVGVAMGDSESIAQVGPFNVLPGVYAYDTGNGVVVPVSGLAAWAGAKVTFVKPHLQITAGMRTIGLRLGGSDAYVDGRSVPLGGPVLAPDGVACAPARALAELLGVGMRYVGWRKSDKVAYVDENYVPDELEAMNVDPFLAFTDGDRTCRVLVHSAPPAVVARVVADLDHSVQFDAGDPDIMIALGSYGSDWILRVGRVRSGYFLSSVPAELDDTIYPGHKVYYSGAWGVYGCRKGTWKMLLGGQDDPSVASWEKAGIPRSIAPLLGLTLRRYP